MRILFDQGTPVPLRSALAPHEVSTAFELGWSRLKNGELLAAAEQRGFDLLITTDKNLRFQQDLRRGRIAIVVLGTTSWRRIQRNLNAVVSVVADARPGTIVEVPISEEV